MLLAPSWGLIHDPGKEGVGERLACCQRQQSDWVWWCSLSAVAAGAKACPNWKWPRPSTACGLITLSYNGRQRSLKIRH